MAECSCSHQGPGGQDTQLQADVCAARLFGRGPTGGWGQLVEGVRGQASRAPMPACQVGAGALLQRVVDCGALHTRFQCFRTSVGAGMPVRTEAVPFQGERPYPRLVRSV